MAKRSVSPRKSLKRLFFSRSTADLQECAGTDERRTSSLFRRGEKKSREQRVESPEAPSAVERDEVWPDPSIYATAPRSKKKLFSQSESDLRKPKRFPLLSFGWLKKKKKKDKDLSQSVQSIQSIQSIGGYESEQENEDPIEQEPPKVTEPEPTPTEDQIGADQLLHQDYRVKSGSLGGELDTAGFTPANIDIRSISYIDDSDHDASQTPPESPGLGSAKFVLQPDGTDDGSKSQLGSEFYSTYSDSPAETVTETPKLGTGDALDANLEYQITVPDFSEPVPEFLENPILSSVDPFPLEDRSTLSDAQTMNIFEGPITSTTGTVAINSSYITEDHPEQSTTDGDWKINKNIRHTPETPEGDTPTASAMAITPDAISDRTVEESNIVHDTFCSPTVPQYSLSNLDPSRSEQNVEMNSCSENVSPGLSIFKPETESFSSNNENAGSLGVSATSGEVADEPLCSSVLSELTSTTELSGFCGNYDKSDKNLDSVEHFLTKTEFYSADITTSGRPVSADTESGIVKLLGSPYTSDTYTNSDPLAHFWSTSGFDLAKKEPNLAQTDPQEAKTSTRPPSDAFNKHTYKTVPPETVSATTDGFCKYQKAGASHLESNKVKGSGEEEHVPIQGLATGYTMMEKTFSSYGRKINEAYEAAWERETLENASTITSELGLYSKREWTPEENLVDRLKCRAEQDLRDVDEKVHDPEQMFKFESEETKIQQQRDQQVFYNEREALEAKADQQLPDLASKPDAPVLQVFVSKECATAPPYSLRGEVTLTGRRQETHLHRGAGSHHALQRRAELLVQEDSAGGGANRSVVRLHVEDEDVNTPEHATAICRDGAGEEIRSFSADPEGRHRSDSEYTPYEAEEILQNKPEILHQAPETDTSVTFSGRTAAAGIIVYIREFDLDWCGIKEDSTTVRADSYSRPPSGSSAGWFPHAALTTVYEDSEAESPVEAPLVSDPNMSSGVGVASTTFTLRPKVSREGQDGKKVRKVSLVSTSSSSSSNSSSLLRIDENGLRIDEIDGHRLDAWRPQHEDYLSIVEESGSFVKESVSTSQSPSVPRFMSEPKDYSYLSFSAERERETPPSSFFTDSASSQGNSTWWNVRSEVQERTEAEAGGRSLVEFAGGREVERDAGITNAGLHFHSDTDETDGFFSDIYTATRVDLLPSPTDTEPEPLVATSPHEIDTLLDRLKSMAPPVRHRALRNTSSLPFSSLPPIVEDAPSPAPAPISSPMSPTPLGSLPPDLGLHWATAKDMLSPFAKLKEQQGQGTTPTSRGVVLPSRASAINSIVMRKSSLPSLTLDEGSQLNGILGSSRLDSSILFSNYRSTQTEQNEKASGHRPLYRAASLPEVNSTQDYLSSISKGSHTLNLAISSLELPYLTSTNSLPGAAETTRISRSSLVIQSSPPQSPTSTHTPSSSFDYNSLPSESPAKPPSLQRRLSSGASSYDDVGGNFGSTFQPGPDRNPVVKYRAFPDAYRTKEKEHGKLNPRPGKLFIYDRPGRQGQRIEVRGDVVDGSPWEFPEACISIRVVRGGWVLYEKPDFKGEKIALDEGDIELTYPFGPQEGDHRNLQNGEQEPGENGTGPEPVKPRRFIIGSLRRAVRDYSVPEICLFPEENAEGKKVVFRDTSDDARIYGFPIKSNSIIINAGVWLVFAEPFFQGVPRVLEVGGFTNPAAWGVTQPYVGSLHPLKIGEPTVERPNEPKLVIYDKPYFTGKSREIYTNMKDFMTRMDQQQRVFMYNVSSIKVIGGIWVGYEKEGFRGHQYLLEEGEYHDWRAWGGCDSELRSVRVIRTDLSQPMAVMYEMASDDKDVAEDEERTLEVTEAVPDVELVDFQPSIRSIQVLSGAWVAYSHVDYSGKQYILEKGFYNNCADWGSVDNRICSLQPILPAVTDGAGFRSELLLYSEPSFQGTCQVHCESEEFLSERRTIRSCRVVGGSWVLYEDTSFGGNQYVLSEGDYTSLSSMGCPETCILRSVKPVPIMLTVPSISLFGLECFEGREVTVDMEVSNMMEGGFNPHFLSVRINNGCWVLCEHSNYRGRQFLLEPTEITNWPKFSSITSIGSVYPIRLKRKLFRIRYKETGFYVSVQGGVDAMKTSRVIVSEQVEGQSDLWLYEDGLIKNKLLQNMSLQVVGSVESGAKVVLWSETRMPVQTWSAQLSGTIASLTYPGLLLDVKGGKTYDKEHVIVRSEAEENTTPLWDIEFI